MVQLKPDPWRADFGAGAEAAFDAEIDRPVVDTFVETSDWSRPLVCEPCQPERLTFVDGVMRTELRVMAVDDERRAWGALGSYAAGAVRCDGRAVFVAEDRGVRRVLLVGSRVDAEPLEVQAGNCVLVYDCHPVADDSPTGLRRALQRLMIRAEQELALQLAGDGLVLADGPLHLVTEAPAEVVGVVKRMVKAYLDPEPAALLPLLAPRQRTPLFAVGSGVVDRYAWYVRLLPANGQWHELAGLVRCEVRMAVGLESARRIADRVAWQLPDYAGRPGVDPRAPQNLTPVGALEARLKHRLGSGTFIGRALQRHIVEGNGHG